MDVLRPERCPVCPGGREDNGISHGQRVFQAQFAGSNGQCRGQVHDLSLSVLIPFRNPLNSAISRSGMSSIRPSCSITCMFCPARKPMDCRTWRGITIWNFGDKTTVGMTRTPSIRLRDIIGSSIKDCQAAWVIDGLKVRQAFLPVAEWWGDGVPA